MTSIPAPASRSTRTISVEEPLPVSDVFFAMLRRDIRVARRELPFFLLRTTMQPLLLMVVFGYLLPKMGMVAKGYTATLLPGVVSLSLALSAVQSVSLPMVAQFGFSKEIEDRLLAPIPSHLVALELVTAGTLQGLFAGLFVLPVGRLIMGAIPGLGFSNSIQIFSVMLLGAAVFSALGLLIGCAINPAQIGLMFSSIIGPMIFFGCMYYPWKGLDSVPVMKYAVLVNPLVYVAEGMRATLTPSVPHMDLFVVSIALLTLLLLFWWLGLRAFMKRAVT